MRGWKVAERNKRIDWELDQLATAGFEVEPPQPNATSLVVHTTVGGERHRLEVSFPEWYPYFRFEVRAPTLSLRHHQHPFGKNLCLIPRGTEHWQTADSVAAYLTTQLPKVLRAGRTPDAEAVIGIEEHQAEPVTSYYSVRPEAMILIDSAWVLPDTFTVGRLSISADVREDKNWPFRGAVAEIRTLRDDMLFVAPAHLQREAHLVDGYVVKLSAPILDDDPAALLQRVRRDYLQAERFTGRTTVVALVMPEEHAWRNETGQGWLFIVSEKGQIPYFARAGRAGTTDLRERAPELEGLSTAAIAVFGLGCLGAPSAIEFAKAGVAEMRLLDHDYVEPGTSLRWPFGLPTAGRQKAPVLATFINAHYPLTRVLPLTYRLGSTGPDRAVIEQMVSGASLIYDATAEPGIAYLLADIARAHAIPFVSVTGTEGGWGGMIVRLSATTGCWYCLQVAGDLGRIPSPPAYRHGQVQPAGCGDPTFTGAGFDLASIALAGVRTAIATISTGYAAQPWDITTIAFRDQDGRLIPPRFDTAELPKNPSCPACG